MGIVLSETFVKYYKEYKKQIKLAKQLDALDGKKDGFIDNFKIAENLTGKKFKGKTKSKPMSSDDWAWKAAIFNVKNQEKMAAKEK